MSTTLEKQYHKWLRSTLRVPKTAKVPLVSAYLSLYRHQREEALRKINRICETSYKMRRFREWERGGAPIPKKVKFLMQRLVISARFGDAGEGILRLLGIKAIDS